MKFPSPLLALAAATCAYSLAIKSPNAIVTVITDVTKSITELDLAANTYNGIDITPIVTAADKVILVIGTGQTVADALKTISILESSTLAQPIADLNVQAIKLYDDVKGRVAEVQAARQCALTREKLGAISTSGRKLIDTVIGKIESEPVKNIAKGYTDQIMNLLDQATELFSEKNCVDAVTK
ncbi:hypothetical protein BGZ94_005929 [Podila epigama]|nr:hypothetical protein BGZ94_005929 [Podila epigama]